VPHPEDPKLRLEDYRQDFMPACVEKVQGAHHGPGLLYASLRYRGRTSATACPTSFARTT